MKLRMTRLAALALALCMMLSSAAFAADTATETDYGSKLDRAIEIYNNYGLYSDKSVDYVREALLELFKEDEAFFYEFVNKIYSLNDRYSYYLKPEVYDNSYVMNNSRIGIGVVVERREDGGVYIKQVSDGPGKEADLRVGDKIVAVDGVDVTDYYPVMIGDLMKGNEGTTVRITVLRDNARKELLATRRKIEVSNVSAEDMGDGVGYIELSHFNGVSTYMDFMDAYDKFEQDGINTVILDLRNNGGGDIGCLINILDNVIPKKDVPFLTTWTAKPLEVHTYASEGYGWEFNKFVILVNEHTASAAEMMAGVLADLGYAELVGTKTYGKGLGQIHTETGDGSEAIVTCSEVMLPVTGKYDGVGLTPKYKVELTKTPYKLPALTKLVSGHGVSARSSVNVRALEERLNVLGYFYDQPDDKFDKFTVHAINMFRRDRGEKAITTDCSWLTIKAADDAAAEREKEFVYTDTQLEKAIEVARKFAASGKKAQCISTDKIRFNK